MPFLEIAQGHLLEGSGEVCQLRQNEGPAFLIVA